jgi:F-type H+-transporting ATPase subunit gamma
MAENHSRLQHMEGAIQHLDDKSEKLKRKAQTFRQEEITEEIEVILLTAESLY